jgi:hypothetical protein
MAELNNNQFPLLSILIYIKGVWVIDTYTLLTDGSLKKVLTTGAGFLQILAPGDWVCHYEKPKGGQGRAKIGSRTERHRVLWSQSEGNLRIPHFCSRVLVLVS